MIIWVVYIAVVLSLSMMQCILVMLGSRWSGCSRITAYVILGAATIVSVALYISLRENGPAGSTARSLGDLMDASISVFLSILGFVFFLIIDFIGWMVEWRRLDRGPKMKSTK